MHELFQNMQSSDDRWLNMFETSGSLEAGAAAQDRIFQLFTTIGGVAEGCFKPQLQILYSFALRDTSTGWPQNVDALDFGALVAGFPINLRTQAPLLLTDPDLGIAVNQWRNIAAHKTFALVGPQTLEVKYGKGKIQTRRFGIHRLRRAWHWLLRTHTAVRLANTITYVEHIRELSALALPSLERRFSATLLHVTHGLSTVGFQSQSWEIENRDGRLYRARSPEPETKGRFDSCLTTVDRTRNWSARRRGHPYSCGQSRDPTFVAEWAGIRNCACSCIGRRCVQSSTDQLAGVHEENGLGPWGAGEVTPRPSIEGTSTSRLRPLAAAAHVER
jgi:hypothetical protein